MKHPPPPVYFWVCFKQRFSVQQILVVNAPSFSPPPPPPHPPLSPVVLVIAAKRGLVSSALIEDLCDLLVLPVLQLGF